MCLSAFLTGFDGPGAIRIFRRDRKNHAIDPFGSTLRPPGADPRLQLAGPACTLLLWGGEKPTRAPIHPVEARTSCGPTG